MSIRQVELGLLESSSLSTEEELGEGRESSGAVNSSEPERARVFQISNWKQNLISTVL